MIADEGAVLRVQSFTLMDLEWDMSAVREKLGLGEVELRVVRVFPDVLGVCGSEDDQAVEAELDESGGWEDFDGALRS